MATDKKNKSELPSVYAVTGSIQPSDFYMYQTSADNIDTLLASHSFRKIAESEMLSPVKVHSKQGFTGTVSNYMNEKAMAKQTLEAPNPGTRDTASLDLNSDTLVVMGSIKLVSLYHSPSISDTPTFTAEHELFVKTYLENKEAFSELIKAYLGQLKNGAILWRNKHGFNKKTVVFLKTQTSGNKKFVLENEAEFDSLTAKVVEVFAVKGSALLLEVACFVEVGSGTEVYPSQPFVTDKSSHEHARGEKNYGRLLSEKNGCAILHSQKVGNALRSIDTWYSEEEGVDPIAVEAYGVVTTQRVVMRNNKNSFYDYFKPGMVAHASDRKIANYLMAMLIKGGVFGQTE